MKKCPKCGYEKDFSFFGLNSAKKDGLQNYCKECRKIHQNQEYKNSILKYRKIYYEKNRTNICKKVKLYREENINIIKLKKSETHKKNAVAIRKRVSYWQTNNSAKVREISAKRRASKILACPSWLSKNDRDEIKLFFDAARAFKIYTGQDYEVDHIVPLQSKKVCGLHVPWNLQVLPKIENLKKRNSIWPDMW